MYCQESFEVELKKKHKSKKFDFFFPIYFPIFAKILRKTGVSSLVTFYNQKCYMQNTVLTMLLGIIQMFFVSNLNEILSSISISILKIICFKSYFLNDIICQEMTSVDQPKQTSVSSMD